MVAGDLVLVHGFWSSGKTWNPIIRMIHDDQRLDGLNVRPFEYPSPKIPKLSFLPSRIPDYDDIGQSLASDLAAHGRTGRPLALVAHSQGGLIVQRFLAWMVAEGRASELARIKLVVLLACPNDGTEYLRALRHALGFSAHPQAKALTALNGKVSETRRTVLRTIVYADSRSDHSCPIPFKVYAGTEDNVVPRTSAQSAFPDAGSLPGDHFSILDPTASNNITYQTLRNHLLDAFSAPAAETADKQPDDARTQHRGITLNGNNQGVYIGDNGTQHNVFGPPER
jgi:pimeloyl-ACP methyl ester carboxylesterase